MKYKELFKKWWFYLVLVFFAIRGLVAIHVPGEKIYFAEVVGSIIGSIPVTLFIMTMIWLAFLKKDKDDKREDRDHRG